ncbi:hypothetical protein MTO96_038911, partial [Rhipicephalus appendiculatus]
MVVSARTAALAESLPRGTAAQAINPTAAVGTSASEIDSAVVLEATSKCIKDDDIVISGFSGHFPQADHVVELKEKLYANVDFVTSDEARWPRGFLGLPARMGTIRDLSHFDAQLFGVNPKQAHLMDPQARLLLETSYEAIVDSGYDPATMRSRNVGVFIGCSASECDEAFSVNTDKIDGYGLAGTYRAMFANRISYAFDFTGPSVTVDTACSSTLSALNHAVLAMRSGQCEAAIVGGCMVALKPATSLGFMQLGMLSPEGKCKAFDERGPHASAIARDKVELPRLLLLAGRTKDSLERTMDRVEKEGPYPDSAYALLNTVGRPSVTHFPYRGYMLVPVDGSSKEVIKSVMETPSTKRPVWFVFTGVGCQWKGMAQQMMHFGVFDRSIRRSHMVLEKVGMDLIELVTSKNDVGAVGPLYGCIAAVEVALVDVLLALGIKPDGMVGHSVGEIGCAYADGCLTAEQTVLSAYWRGHCVDTGNLPPGAMAAVGLTWEEATKRCPDGVQPACHNAEDSVTVSGVAEAVANWVEELRAEGVFVREVNSAGVAFHSKYMERIGPAFLQAMKK